MTKKIYTGVPLRIMEKATNDGPGSVVSGSNTSKTDTTIMMMGSSSHTCIKTIV